jgi:tetratricopeptide (TPR) repeat protein
MRRIHRPLAIGLLCVQAIAHAAGGGGDAPTKTPEDPVIASARAAIARQDWAGAQAGLKQALESNPGRADYHNLYAYSVRKGPDPDMNVVFGHYQEALRIDPKHRAAHEYMGEAYLQVNDLPKAREHLAALDRLCFLPCEEYSDLKKAVNGYEANHKAQVAQQRQ